MQENKFWFSFYTHKEYVATELPFVDINNIKGVKKNYLDILKEFEQYLAENNLRIHFNCKIGEKEAR